MPTAQVRVELDGRKYGPIRALIDTGAQPNLISHQLQNRLSLSKTAVTRRLIGVEGEPFHIKYKTTLKVSPWFNSQDTIEQEFYILPQNSKWQPVVPTHDLEMPKMDIVGRPLADPEFWKAGPVDLLLGCRFAAASFLSILDRQASRLLCIETLFGKVVLGEFEGKAIVNTEQGLNIIAIDNNQLHESLKRLWQLDDIESLSNRSQEQEQVEQNFINTYSRDDSGRVIATIPLKESAGEIGSSELMAKRRFLALERKLQNDLGTKQKYVDFMREYERMGHMTPVTGATHSRIIYHIPHHCVAKKFRVVFDASCRTMKGISLNEVQMLGEKLQKDLHEILMRFRRHRVAISADIKMMFRMVKIAREQWDLQRIFWRENPNDRLKEYWLTVVTYGMTSSAHNAVRALIQCAKDAEHEFPDAARAIIEDFYMDDCTTGADSEQKAIELSKDIDQVLKGAGFELRKWKSNSKALVRNMNYEEQESILFEDDEKSSILGIKWLLEKDQFTFVVKSPVTEQAMTKRKIVSCVAQLYDPNGFIAPVTIVGKILIQDIWRLNVDWDERLPKEIEKR
ncbi:uncharacterized protein LOC129953494 [Eupeodes corollae]|uniref:uncharacterized protein LOC129953461 n=1 Tax=Eupeodes corollae TaxID=290404 RepID=UPI002490A821|nr:uncharacterized protein LOC129953461 [Eupeodes corollae]XP_055922712.1 uncharacterized protein LOC129953494 [Eupeodes corollae]